MQAAASASSSAFQSYRTACQIGQIESLAGAGRPAQPAVDMVAVVGQRQASAPPDDRATRLERLDLVPPPPARAGRD